MRPCAKSGRVKGVDSELKAALAALGFPVKRLVYRPKKGEAPPGTYFTFQRILSRPDAYADDESTVTAHYYRVHLFSIENYNAPLKSTVNALTGAGFTVENVGGEIYESDTGYYHVPIDINILEG